MPDRNVVEDLKAAEDMMKRGITGLDIVKALMESGFNDVGNNVFNMLKQRIAGDYLHTSAILDSEFNIISAVNDCNDYMGPGTGYRISDERWEEIKNIANAVSPEDY
jgi:propanediol dehydratase large subunit/glycerol dehydratase large subunit